MFIVDAQIHIWPPSTPQRPWRADEKPHRAKPLEADEVLREMDAAGVSRAVLIAPHWDGPRNDVVLAAAHAHPDRFAAMGRLDGTPPPQPGEIVKWRQQRGMLGLRCSFSRGETEATLAALEWVWTEAEQGGVPLMVLVPHGMAHIIDAVAERHPHLNLIMSHLGLTGNARDAEAFRDIDKLLALAKRPNVAVKVSALPQFSNDVYPYRALHPYLRRVYDTFGPKRMFWGTDMARLPCTYRQSVTMFTEEIPWLSNEDKEWIMGRGLCQWLKWPMPDNV